MKYRVLAINPGSTSTKIAVYENYESIFVESLKHTEAEMSAFDGVIQQYEFRKELVLESMRKNDIALCSLDAVVGRGGLVKPIAGGIYRVNDKMLTDLRNTKLWGRIHAANLGAFIAKSIADEIGVPSFIVDPVSVDEFPEIARISGIPEIKRKSLLHALNIRYTARKLSEQMNKTFEEMNMIAVHLGGGISVAAIRNGKIVDVNNALLGMGPFSPQRAGALPIGDLLEMAYSGKYSYEELIHKFSKKSGFIAYLGTDDGLEIERRVKSGDEKAELIVKAMCYQIGKEIGACAAVLCGKVDAIFLTGGLAYDEFIVKEIKRLTGFIAPIYLYPGENEMEALCQEVMRVLKGLETAKEY